LTNDSYNSRNSLVAASVNLLFPKVSPGKGGYPFRGRGKCVMLPTECRTAEANRYGWGGA
jgi:hypothetical protein